MNAVLPAAPRPPARDFGALPMPARALITSLAVIVAILTGIVTATSGQIDWIALGLMTGLAIASERFDIDLYGDSRLSISGLFLLTTAILVGPTGVVVIGVLIAITGHLGRGRALHKLVFNAASFAGSGLAAAYVFRIVSANVPGELGVGAIAAASVDFVVSSILVSLIIAFTAGGRASDVWREKFLWLAPHYLVLGFLAFVLAMAYDALGTYGVLGFAAPALMMRLTMKQYVDRTERTVQELRAKNAEIHQLTDELRDAYGETLDAFVAALDTRDTETHGHSDRVADLSLRIGEALGIQPETREWIELKHGALLHDIGKIGVPDAVLRKPGPLSDEEWQIIRQHPQHGYNMLRTVRFLSNAAELVLCHHERYDGKGYPRGLRGEEIPLAARIFAVADTFDAITSERPYKPAFSVEAACREISTHSGTQFDPAVVDVFLDLIARSQSAPASTRAA